MSRACSRSNLTSVSTQDGFLLRVRNLRGEDCIHGVRPITLRPFQRGSRGDFWFAFFSRRMNLKEAMIYDSMKHKFISLELIEIKAKALYTFISISSK
jgi:hypothetical protein